MTTYQHTHDLQISFGDIHLLPQVDDGGQLISIGEVRYKNKPLRGGTRWLPWFDSLEGEVFNRFRFTGLEVRGVTHIIRTRAISDNDYPFRERRDSSGDPCFRNINWGAKPIEAQLDICFEAVEKEWEGRSFHGFKYWFEYSGATPIHRLVDRGTWELDATVSNLNLVCRNWLTPPLFRLEIEKAYSTVGLNEWANLMPGNLWARWSLLPAFDFQFGNSGLLLAWFDQVSLIRTVLESGANEDALRVLDMHLFEQSTQVTTNAKTVLFCPDVLDDVAAMNLWTRVHDTEAEKARWQFGLPREEAPAIVFHHNVWKDIRFDSTYEASIDIASEFGADYVFIDPVWEHQQAFKESLDEVISPDQQVGTISEKFWQQNMCVTLDFEVAQIHGGEAGLRALCERAAQKELKILSWMALHLSPNAALQNEPQLGLGAAGIYAGRESGRHPDTGYPASCWPLNLHSPIYDKVRAQLLGVCERTGLAGYLWDSFSNLGWWQLDYSGGTLKPQFERVMALYHDLEHAGLYVQAESLAAFSSHSCCGLHGGNVYDGAALGYSYNTSIDLQWDDGQEPFADHANKMLRGELPVELLFRCLAHKRVPTLRFHDVSRENWHGPSEREIKRSLALYKRWRSQMTLRTVLANDQGVLWQDEGKRLIWCFSSHERTDGPWTNVENGETSTLLQVNQVYSSG